MGNRGIIMNGGSIQAGSLAVGTRAQASSGAQTTPANASLDEIKAKLEELIQTLHSESGRLANPSQAQEATANLADELSKEKPSKHNILGALEQVTGAAGGVTSVLTAVKGLMAAAAVLF
ncbi:MAG TPA: hypothetical protein VMP68_14780 [Candidatus Eisenbacteria bacterium]|nr:hypothetical protein [Candidatus Eisenbacteria bacterium]